MRETARVACRLGAWLGVALLSTSPAAAQSFGLGGRLGMVRPDVRAESPAERFTGGHIRARVSPRVALEVALDLRTTTSAALTERVREYPIQGSLLLFPFRTPVAPYVLGGAGWYTRRLETLVSDNWIEADAIRRFGWHAGVGAELRLGRRAALHGDYRYTFLRFGGDHDPPGTSSGFSRILPSHEGSMWTTGLTVYF